MSTQFEDQYLSLLTELKTKEQQLFQIEKKYKLKMLNEMEKELKSINTKTFLSYLLKYRLSSTTDNKRPELIDNILNLLAIIFNYSHSWKLLYVSDNNLFRTYLTTPMTSKQQNKINNILNDKTINISYDNISQCDPDFVKIYEWITLKVKINAIYLLMKNDGVDIFNLAKNGGIKTVQIRNINKNLQIVESRLISILLTQKFEAQIASIIKSYLFVNTNKNKLNMDTLLTFGYIRQYVHTQDIPTDIKNLICLFEKPFIPNSFIEMNLKHTLLKSIDEYGWKIPTICQQKYIPIIFENVNIFFCNITAEKVFPIPALQFIDEREKVCQILICTDNVQYQTSIIKVLAPRMYIKIRFLNKKKKQLRRQIIIGKNAPIYAIIRKKEIDVSKVKLVVFVSFDDHIRRGNNKKIMYNIVKSLPSTTQILFFCEQYKRFKFDMNEFRSELFNNGQLKIISNQKKINGYIFEIGKTTKHYFIEIGTELVDDKLIALHKILEMYQQAIIYCKSGVNTDIIISNQRGRMYGNNRCEVVTSNFKSWDLLQNKIIITTDLFARTNEFQQICTIINYDLPIDILNYAKRVGSTGVYNVSYISINLISSDDKQQVREIEQYYDITMHQLVNYQTIQE
eukprot:5576_1